MLKSDGPVTCMANPWFAQLGGAPVSPRPKRSPNTKSDPALVYSKNPTALLPNHSKPLNPVGHRKMTKPNIICRSIPENTTCHDTLKKPIRYGKTTDVLVGANFLILLRNSHLATMMPMTSHEEFEQ